MLQRVLILGGTTESRQLAAQLTVARSKLDIVLSLAGRTREPIPYPVPLRIGGFGGARGLIDYLRERQIDLLIDATHPFAAQMSRHAAAGRGRNESAVLRALPPRLAAGRRRSLDRRRFGYRRGRQARQEATPRIRCARPAGAGAARCGAASFLSRAQRRPGRAAARHPRCALHPDRGPFAVAAERTLLSENKIDAVLAKNSGGDATYAKIAAARDLGIEVVLVRRPTPNGVETVESVPEAVLLAAHRLPSVEKRGV